jgi:glycosyltransferase involved in cell wall biosynthesis
MRGNLLVEDANGFGAPRMFGVQSTPVTAGGGRPDSRPGVAVICNSLPPYRLHVQRRIFNEVPEIKLWTVLSHEGDGRWPLVEPAELNVVSFGRGERSSNQPKARRALHEWRKGGRVVRWLERQRVSAVVLVGYNDAGRLRLLRWCQQNQRPCFIAGDSNIKDEAVRGVKAFVKRLVLPLVLRQATGLLPCGRLGKEYFLRYGVPLERIFPFPVEPDYGLLMGTSADEVEKARRQFGLSCQRRCMVFSGRLSREKRVDLLIDAFALVAAERPHWDLLICGDGGLRGELGFRVPSSLRQRVLWAGHVSDAATLAAIYRASDVLVLPSDHEPWALVINEAAAAGLAIVSSDVPGAAAELVRDGRNGRIFPAGDVAALADCLRDVTRSDKIDAMKAASSGILAEWRHAGDPIQGLRRALASCGVLRP